MTKFYPISSHFKSDDDMVPEYYREQDNVESYYKDSYNYSIRGMDQILRDGASELSYDYRFFVHPEIR